MDHLNYDGAFTNAGRHSLDRVVPYIAGGKHAGNRRFEQIWIAIERPALWAATCLSKERGRSARTSFVHRQDAVQPAGARRSSDEDEKSGRGNPFHGIGVVVANH